MNEVTGSPKSSRLDEFQYYRPMPSLRSAFPRALLWLLHAVAGSLCMLALLAVAASIPIIQPLVVGYVMESQGRVARSGKWCSAIWLLPAAQRIGGIVLAVSFWTLPVVWISDFARDSQVIAPGTRVSTAWTLGLCGISVLVTVHLILAFVAGGGFWRFFRPWSNVRHFMRQRAKGEVMRRADEQLRGFIAALEIRTLLEQALAAYLGVYCWLGLPIVLSTQLVDVTSPTQIAMFLTGSVLLCLMLPWIPILIVHVAAQRRLGAVWELRIAGSILCRSPFLGAFATALLLACSALPLLYMALVKIQIPPHAALWDVMLVSLVTGGPVKVLLGWVYHRAQCRAATPLTWIERIWCGFNLLALLIGTGYYLYFLHLAATGGELGSKVIWQMHAVLLPCPF